MADNCNFVFKIKYVIKRHSSLDINCDLWSYSQFIESLVVDNAEFTYYDWLFIKLKIVKSWSLKHLVHCRTSSIVGLLFSNIDTILDAINLNSLYFVILKENSDNAKYNSWVCLSFFTYRMYHSHTWLFHFFFCKFS